MFFVFFLFLFEVFLKIKKKKKKKIKNILKIIFKTLIKKKRNFIQIFLLNFLIINHLSLNLYDKKI